MAEPTDVISLDEARSALNIQEAADDPPNTALASFITAVSQRLDDLCGAIVHRTVTDEQYPGGVGHIILRQAPASQTATTTVTAVSEYAGGTAQALTAEGLTSSTAYNYDLDAKTGILSRRSSWADSVFGIQRVKVTYSPGRYADTDAVAAKFKQAAAIMLSHLWTNQHGVGGSATFGSTDSGAGIPTFYVPNAVLELLADELRPPAVG